MTSGDSVRGDERLRLFLALRLPGDRLDAIAAWQARAFAGRRVRVVPREYLHVTLVFRDEGGAGGALADAAGRDEPRPWLPHVTVARYRERPRLKEEFPDTIRTDVLVPSDAAAYLSRLRPTGAEYDVLASVGLGGFE